MPTIACPNRILCGGAGNFGALYDLDFPILNRSSEGGDPVRNISWFYGEWCKIGVWSTYSQDVADKLAHLLGGECPPDNPCDPTTDPDCPTCQQVLNPACPCPNPLRDDCGPICIPSIQKCVPTPICIEGVDPNCPVPPPDDQTPPPPPPVILYYNDPQTCVVTCPDGSTQFSYTVAAHLFADYTEAGADLKAYTYACRQAILQRICLTGIDDDGTGSTDKICFGNDWDRTIICEGGLPESMVLQSGALPDGVDFIQLPQSPDRVFLMGTPTESGTFTFTIRATMDSGNYAERTYTLHVVSIDNSTPLAEGDVGDPYSVTLTETGGVPPVSWQLASGSLPDGLLLDEETGEIHGTPTVDGTFNFTVVLQDEAS